MKSSTIYEVLSEAENRAWMSFINVSTEFVEENA